MRAIWPEGDEGCSTMQAQPQSTQFQLHDLLICRGGGGEDLILQQNLASPDVDTADEQ